MPRRGIDLALRAHTPWDEYPRHDVHSLENGPWVDGVLSLPRLIVAKEKKRANTM